MKVWLINLYLAIDWTRIQKTLVDSGVWITLIALTAFVKSLVDAFITEPYIKPAAAQYAKNRPAIFQPFGHWLDGHSHTDPRTCVEDGCKRIS